MSLEVVLGPMFSGKSSYALSYVRRQRAIGKRVLVVKPDIDKRYSDDNFMITHDKERVQCMMWDTQHPLCQINHTYFAEYDSFVIEEAQFFKDLKHFCYEAVFHEKRNLLVVGLDGCAQQKKFGEVLDVIPLSTSVTKLTALCCLCRDGTSAPYTRKLETEWGGEEQVDVGGAEKYIAVCLRHL